MTIAHTWQIQSLPTTKEDGQLAITTAALPWAV